MIVLGMVRSILGVDTARRRGDYEMRVNWQGDEGVGKFNYSQGVRYIKNIKRENYK